MSHTHSSLTKLQNRRVLLIGGTSGSGFAVAEAAIEHGAEVIVSSSTQAKISMTIERLHTVPRPLSLGSEKACVTGYVCDLADASKLEANLIDLLDAATSTGTNRLHHVVFTAGDAVGAVGSFKNITVAGFHKAQIVRVLAPTILGKLLPKYIHEEATSSFTLTSGANAYRPAPGLEVYTSLTASLEGLTRGLAVALKPVRVNAVMLGLVLTEMHDAWPDKLREHILEQCKATTLVGSAGNPKDVAEAYIHFMKNAFAAGTVMVCDGGQSMT